ncbi:cell wall metabolism sensor histidine kinase WalK [Jeotgalibacillus sp. S-D1]|uniref:sensor histidine kinase n=1 Tax=Jeotgalibacillus sp. S-D1 TaxID=2552189 RepID=UPI001F0F6589|nr:HAMP domain-containing sensor histidine kinase [Jeotgalibacillus sp. S-D1]
MLIILSLILVMIGFSQYIVLKDFLYKNEAEQLRGKISSVPIGALGEFSDLPGGRERGHFFLVENLSLSLIQEDGTYIDLLENNGLVSPQLSEAKIDTIKQNLVSRNREEYHLFKDETGTEQLVLFRPALRKPNRLQNGEDAILQMGVSTAPLQQLLWKHWLTFMMLSIFAIAAGIWIYFTVIKKTLGPLSNIVSSVQTINASNMAYRIPQKQGQEEIDLLSESFNDMLQRLEVSFGQEREAKEKMRRFIADASHELRTPLTSVYGYLEVLLRGAAQNPNQLSMALDNMYGETKRVIKLVEELLLLAKLDQTPELELQSTNLTELIQDMSPHLSILAGKRVVTFHLNNNVYAKVNPDKMKQVILNLVQNAIQHTDAMQGRINIRLEVKEKTIHLNVEDNGSGIEKEKQPNVFDRFYRIDYSRNREYGGTGLGLSITKAIVEAHQGKVDVVSALGEGASFGVYLPLE